MDQRFCIKCRRSVEWLEGIGWLHVDARVYFGPQVESACDAAEPAEMHHFTVRWGLVGPPLGQTMVTVAETEQLIAELRRYLAWDVPADLALKALNDAMAERPLGAGAVWLVKRAAYIIQRGA